MDDNVNPFPEDDMLSLFMDESTRYDGSPGMQEINRGIQDVFVGDPLDISPMDLQNLNPLPDFAPLGMDSSQGAGGMTGGSPLTGGGVPMYPPPGGGLGLGSMGPRQGMGMGGAGGAQQQQQQQQQESQPQYYPQQQQQQLPPQHPQSQLSGGGQPTQSPLFRMNDMSPSEWGHNAGGIGLAGMGPTPPGQAYNPPSLPDRGGGAGGAGRKHERPMITPSPGGMNHTLTGLPLVGMNQQLDGSLKNEPAPLAGDEDASRRQRRLEKNRESARQSRRRKKQYLELLEEKVRKGGKRVGGWRASVWLGWAFGWNGMLKVARSQGRFGVTALCSDDCGSSCCLNELYRLYLLSGCSNRAYVEMAAVNGETEVVAFPVVLGVALLRERMGGGYHSTYS